MLNYYTNIIHINHNIAIDIEDWYDDRSMKNDTTIYVDYAAATPVDPEVLAVMQPYYRDVFGNPSSIHAYGRAAKAALEDARARISRILNCSATEIIFTGSGTESLLVALRGIGYGTSKRHIITSQIEHPAVLSACEQLGTEGFEITYVPVGADGLVDPTAVAKSIRSDTALISVMYANNEIGTVQPIAEIVQVAHDSQIPFHTDACQAAGFLNLDVPSLEIDALTLNGSKIYGPKGIGLLYYKRGVPLHAVMAGGGQESGRRGGTENVPGIMGLARALEMAQAARVNESQRLTVLRDYMIKKLEDIPGVHLNGHRHKRLPNNVHVSCAGFDGQSLVGLLDQKGIACSSASACASLEPDPSHVLLAIGASYEQSFEGVRFSLGRATTGSHLNRVVSVVKELINR